MEKNRIFEEAAKNLFERNPEATRQIEQIVQQSKELDIPITPDIKRADINALLIIVLHNYNPKPFSYPFSSRYRLSSYFGIRNLQYRRASLKKHCGIDIAAPRGTPILALTDGVVKMQFNHKFGGKSVIIEANQSHQGKRVRYSACHMQNFNRDLREGSRVSKGKTIIGYVGSTGRSTGPHVHLTNYEYSKSENSWLKVNPLKYTQGCALPDNFNANRYQFENCSQISRAI